jgi:hypothetical protein
VRELEKQDIYWVGRRMPKAVWELLLAHKSSLFLAGGYIRACIANETPSDIDLFSGSIDAARAVAVEMVAKGKGLRMVETDNAFTVLGLSVPVQFIHRWWFNDPNKCVESFDFTIARAAVWFNDEKDSERHAILQSCCDERFYPDLPRSVWCIAPRFVMKTPADRCCGC